MPQALPSRPCSEFDRAVGASIETLEFAAGLIAGVLLNAVEPGGEGRALDIARTGHLALGPRYSEGSQ
jgi:hypothetical protein